MLGNVEPWVAVLPLALADSPSAHTVGTGDYIVVVHTVEGMVVAADRTVVDMAATACIVLFAHRLFVGRECLPS